ncbi:hypothetical protein O3G_MSEX008535 [Manduca sexta]|uniref:Retrovirus-related Pol polyprotein from transposon TNT 1-94-like beta-barrel domain-containing protein n=1 Tax=Manduca sexta TaxID=7130 RepID=A0A921ZC30_MANSE|nr:hypothetical protein O3G_MSEX008535 [Manduca sexta]
MSTDADDSDMEIETAANNYKHRERDDSDRVCPETPVYPYEETEQRRILAEGLGSYQSEEKSMTVGTVNQIPSNTGDFPPVFAEGVLSMNLSKKKPCERKSTRRIRQDMLRKFVRQDLSDRTRGMIIRGGNQDDEDDVMDIQFEGTSTVEAEKMYSEGHGEVHLLLEGQTQNTKLCDVVYVPGLSTNLISVGKMASKGLEVHFSAQKCNIYCGKIAVASATMVNGVYQLDVGCQQPTSKRELCATSYSVTANGPDIQPSGRERPEIANLCETKSSQQ